MEKLYELHMQGEFDLLVLDTPPTRNALDFLDAPERLHRFIDSRSLRFFLSPGVKLLGRGSGLLFAVLQRVTGIDLLRDLSAFFQASGDMSEGSRARAERVTELLGSDAATFVLVAAPRQDAIDDAIFFHDQLEERRMPFGGIVVNRFHDARGDDAEVDLDVLVDRGRIDVDVNLLRSGREGVDPTGDARPGQCGSGNTKRLVFYETRSRTLRRPCRVR